MMGGLAAAAMEAGGTGEAAEADEGMESMDPEGMLPEVGRDLMDAMKSGDVQAFTDNMRAFVDLAIQGGPVGA
jgi:hypothetical protein